MPLVINCSDFCLLSSYLNSTLFFMKSFLAITSSNTHIDDSILCVCVCVYAKLLQSCPTLCDPMDCSLPGSSIHGILQARILEWVAMPFSRASFQPRDGTCIHPRLLRSPALAGRFCVHICVDVYAVLIPDSTSPAFSPQ